MENSLAGRCVLPGGGHEDPLGVESGEEVGSGPDPLVGLLDIQDIESVLSDLVDEVLHVCALVLGSDVDTGGEIDILGDEEFAFDNLNVFVVAHLDSSFSS